MPGSAKIVSTIRAPPIRRDRKSTRLNSSHLVISYAVFCLKKKTHAAVQTPHAPPLRAAPAHRATSVPGMRPPPSPAGFRRDVVPSDLAAARPPRDALEAGH